MATFRQRAYRHLGHYKRNRLGVDENGVWLKTGQTYAHILPQNLHRLNILEGIRAEFFAYRHPKPVKLHTDFHHLNSSQALCFNLFFPFCCTPDADPAPLLRLLGVEADGFSNPEFEAKSAHREGTSFDFAADLVGGGRLLVEVKFTEGEFGGTKDDEAHVRKREKTYMPLLEDKVRPEALRPKVFFANYQILRNVAHVNLAAGHSLRLLVPKENEGLRSGLQFIEDYALPDVKPLVKVAYLEDVLQRLHAQKAAFPPHLATHVGMLVEKYAVPGTDPEN